MTDVEDTSAASGAVTDFLASAAIDPSALLVDGEPGIGKTNLWLAAVQEARRRGFHVMSARPAASESVLAYAALADLLAGVGQAAGTDLPTPQRLALDRVLLRADADREATNPRAVAAAYLSVLERLAEDTPVLIAIDDLQWLDASSKMALAFAARRLSAPVKILGTMRTDRRASSAVSWLQLASPAAVRRLTMGPLSLGGLHAVVVQRLGRSFSRPVMLRIHEISGGNPFYALELARAIVPGTSHTDVALPNTLAEVVRTRIGNLDPAVKDALLTAACLPAPTVELVSAAIGTDADLVAGLLEQAETEGIVVIEGHQLRFAHPLLARGVYTEAPLDSAGERTVAWLASSPNPSCELGIWRWRPSAPTPRRCSPWMRPPNQPASEAPQLPPLSCWTSRSSSAVTLPSAGSPPLSTISAPATPGGPENCSSRSSPSWPAAPCARRRCAYSRSSGSSMTASPRQATCSNGPSAKSTTVWRFGCRR
ncbi:MAG TPA: AAA family ATPase [Mycobacterium sp.]|nr:AAA family ATPase [Mycobacterium sp.]